ncbi:MAG: aromatic ring-hydroxylating dioxygenase subunit alpha [Hyphomonadaceae bacterium]
MERSTNAQGLILDDKEAGIFRVHRTAFVDPDIMAMEKERIFDKSWLFAGHQSEFPNPGDFVTRTVAGRPLILCTGDDGKVRAMLNTCRHRGNLVCREASGKGAEVFRCFYHGWIFNTRGELKGIPGEEAYSDAFDREALGLEPVPAMYNYRGLVFVSFDPNIESFHDYMGGMIEVFDNTLDMGEEMEFVHGHYKYSMRANWKLLVENSMDGYHGLYTHERFFTHFMKDMNLQQPPQNGAPGERTNNGGFQDLRAMGHGHVVPGFPSPNRPEAIDTVYLKKYAKDDYAKFREDLDKRHGKEKAKKVIGGQGNYLVFPNLMVVSGWYVFRTFYPTTPNYMEINGWTCIPKNESPELHKARLDWCIGFQGPGGFATPDDVEGLEGCQMGFETHREVEWSDISRGMKGIEAPFSELQMRVFWREWNARMTTGKSAENYYD